jgi:hypothetical protein
LSEVSTGNLEEMIDGQDAKKRWREAEKMDALGDDPCGAPYRDLT